MKVLTDNKNSTGRVQHLKSCQPTLKLTNKIRGVAISNVVEVTMVNDSSDSSDSYSTPRKSNLIKSNTPLKSLLLSNTPYHSNSAEKCKLVGLLLDLIVDMNLPISTVEHPSLVRYSSGMNNRFRIPCRQTYTNRIIPQKVCNFIYFLYRKTSYFGTWAKFEIFLSP